MEALDGIPVKDTSAQPQSLVEILGEAFAKKVECLIKILPKVAQDKVREAVKDSVEEGIMAAVERAMRDSALDDKARERIKKIVEGAIKQPSPDEGTYGRFSGSSVISVKSPVTDWLL